MKKRRRTKCLAMFQALALAAGTLPAIGLSVAVSPEAGVYAQETEIQFSGQSFIVTRQALTTDTVKNTLTYVPSGGSISQYKIDNSDIATVDNNGKVTFIKAGLVSVSAISGSSSASYWLDIFEDSSDPLKAKAIYTWDNQPLSMMYQIKDEDTSKLYIKNSTSGNTWISSHQDVAKVESDGTLKIQDEEGWSVINAKDSDGKLIAAQNIIVAEDIATTSALKLSVGDHATAFPIAQAQMDEFIERLSSTSTDYKETYYKDTILFAGNVTYDEKNELIKIPVDQGYMDGKAVKVYYYPYANENTTGLKEMKEVTAGIHRTDKDKSEIIFSLSEESGTFPVFVLSHEHDYAPGWVYDKDSHWHNCLVGDGSQSQHFSHNFKNGICTVCSYKNVDTPEPGNPTIPVTPADPVTDGAITNPVTDGAITNPVTDGAITNPDPIDPEPDNKPSEPDNNKPSTPDTPSEDTPDDPSDNEPNDNDQDESDLTGNELADRTDLPFLLATVKQNNKKNTTISWKAYKGATGYDVFWSKCNGKRNFKLLKSTKSKTARHGNLKKETTYKYYVAAYKIKNGIKTYTAMSPKIHISLYNDKRTNAKKITVNKASVTLKKGKKFTIKASAEKEVNSKKLLAHVNQLRYLSSKKSVAAVNKKGVITAKKAGSCKVYVFANNGVYKAVNVTVK